MMENDKGFITKDDGCQAGRFTISSKAIKHSKLELAWRVGVTVAVIVLIVMALTGCASPKNIDRNTQVDYSGALQQMQFRMDSLLVNMQMQRKEMSEKLSNLKIENRTVYLSTPDSTGKQYPTQISDTNINKEEKETQTIDTELSVTMQQLVAEVSDLRQKLDAAISDREKVKEVSWWDLYKVEVVLGALVIVGWLVYRMRRR